MARVLDDPELGAGNRSGIGGPLVPTGPIMVAGTLIPYMVAGAGGITIHPIGSGTSWIRPAANAGAGLEYRFARWGVRAEARDFVYQFDQYGYDHTQNQVAWQGGVTLSF